MLRDVPCRDLSTRAKAEPGADPLDVRFSRTLSDDEFFGDLAIGPALRDECRDLELARRYSGERRAVDRSQSQTSAHCIEQGVRVADERNVCAAVEHP